MDLRELPEIVDLWTGIALTPGYGGEFCRGNGERPGEECCCDACDYYLECFPDWQQFVANDAYLKK